MRILSFLILCEFLVFSYQRTESPHGNDFNVACKTCHSSKGWQLDKKIYSFDHNTTRLPLVGQHNVVKCGQCHISLVFKEAKSECNECHNDVHQSTVGMDCSRCHTPASWLVSNIIEIHRMTRFPLTGAHRAVDCNHCHKSETNVRFDVSGVNCIDCHRQNYMAATNPNHILSGFSENCSSCHPLNAFQWVGAGFNHNFFPLKLGHSSLKCADCHKTTNYSDAKSDCYSCHQQNFLDTKNPDHNILKFSTNCQDCHSLSSGWIPASYTLHDKSFPIYSGRHKGRWTLCTDCHTNASNYILFDCKRCHGNVHRNNNYTNAQCYNCHPRGTGG